MYTVRNYGNDARVATIEELKSLLSDCYKGLHVAVHHKKPSGIVHVDYVSVDENGQVTKTYGGGNYFNAA